MNAQEIATLAHQGQFRRDGVTPYIKHPEAVASAFEEGSLEHDAALLHDVFEDNPNMTREYLLDNGIHFEVVNAVAVYLTHKKGDSYKDYIEKIAYHADDSLPAQIALKVKLADIASNLADAPTERQIKKYTNALKIIAKSLWQIPFSCYTNANKENKTMNQEQLKQEIESTKGRFFSITFDKKNGETRTINAKTMRSNGGESCSAAAGYVSVYNRNKKSWASVHPDRVKSLRCGAIEKTF